MPSCESRRDGAVLAGLLPDPRPIRGAPGLDSTNMPTDHVTAELPASDLSGLWTSSEALAPPLTEQQVTHETEANAHPTSFIDA